MLLNTYNYASSWLAHWCGPSLSATIALFRYLNQRPLADMYCTNDI